ncbi:hypothetical protein IQ264_27455 [Phormidium sp. LEGE 05292]|uniref:hypothetical protein n=1 Tax=[Phormidium] sp. LEGE 05292 TaxID=767427 RepID=UPI00187ED706|nr:hypothetical protein [Phormidium sp. LEGE 05292]MBE9229144.1 hypothetical protein [Phormidium sp. LEGE 05292]
MATTKFSQIPSELKRHGINPTQDAIDAVTAILQNDNRVTVASAVKRYASTVNQQPTNADTSEDSDTQSQLEELTEDMSDRIAEGIVSEAVNRAIDKVLGGNWKLNAKAKTKVQDARKAINVEFSTVKESFLSLPSVGLSTEKLLPSSEEIFDHAVVGVSSNSESTS